MNLFANLLSKVKHKEQHNTIPSNLTQIIKQSSRKKKVERKFIILLVVALLLIVTGFGTVYFFESYLPSFSTGLTPPQNRCPVPAREKQHQYPLQHQQQTRQRRSSSLRQKPEQRSYGRLERELPPPLWSGH